MARWRDSRQMGSQLQNQRARAFQLFRDSYTYTEELNSDKVKEGGMMSVVANIQVKITHARSAGHETLSWGQL